MRHLITLKTNDNTSPSIEYELIRSKRKTCSIALNEDGSLTVRVPLYAHSADIDRILLEKQQWICNALQKQRIRQEAIASRPACSEAAKQALEQRYRSAAREYFPKRVAYYHSAYAFLTKHNYSRITIRDQKTRWGSLSSNGTLSFNWRLMLAPPAILDYVVVHELCHLEHMNHSKEFWQCVESILPDYREKRAWLKEHGYELTLS